MTWKGSLIPGGAWEFKHDTTGASIIIDYIYPIARGLEAWVELRVGDETIPVSQGQRNLMVAGAINPFVTDAEIVAGKIPWREGLRVAFHEVIETWRLGAATIDLSTVVPKGLTFIVDPIVETGGNTRIIAPGGSGKSLFALAIYLTVITGSAKFLGLQPSVTGPCMYLDWETNPETHAQRIHALCGPLGIPVPGRDLMMYRNESVPLARQSQAVARAVARSGAVMLIVDSAKMAAGPSGQSSGEESTLSMYMALREIGVPALIVDHKSNEAIQKNRLGGYGSVYNENLARLQWEYTSYSRKGEIRQWVLSLTKENNVGELPPMAFVLETKGGKAGITSARFGQANPESVMAQADDGDLAGRLYTVLAAVDEPVDITRICELLGPDAKRETVRARLARDNRFVNVAASGKTGRYRLADHLLGAPRDDGIQATLETTMEALGAQEVPPPADDGYDDEDRDLLDPTAEPPTNFRVGDEVF